MREVLFCHQEQTDKNLLNLIIVQNFSLDMWCDLLDKVALPKSDSLIIFFFLVSAQQYNLYPSYSFLVNIFIIHIAI